MNKKEAMEFLGKKERQLANYVSAGRLPVDYVTVKGIRTADYKHEDVARLKSELDAESRPATVANAPSATPSAGVAPVRNATPASNPLARVQHPLQGGIAGTGYHLNGPDLATLIEMAAQNRSEDTQSLAVLPLLTFTQAATLTGISEKRLRDAARAGALITSKNLGRAQKMRRSDLDKWVDSQFE